MGVCDLPLMDKVCGAADFATDPAGAVTDRIGAWIAKSAAELATAAADLAASAVDTTTAIDLNAGWFRENYELVLPIGLALIVGTFCIQLVSAAWRRDERALAQAVMGTVVGVLFSFCAVAFTSVAITVVDALSDGLFATANTSIEEAVRRVVKIQLVGSTYGMGWGVSALVGWGCAIGAFLYWAVMVARKVGVLVLATLAIFAGAGGGWEVAKRWRRGWIEATATLVVSKLLMTVVFLIGISAMGETDTNGGLAALSDAMAGIVVMVLVLLCPYATYKFVHWASDGGGHDDLHRTGVAGMAVAAGAAKTAGTLAMQYGTGGMSTPAPQGPAQVPGADGQGVASGISGISPSGGDLSKQGIDGGAPQPQTRFRFGEDPDGTGDKGRPLIQRPSLPPLIVRPGAGEAPATEPGDDAVSVAPPAAGGGEMGSAPAAPSPAGQPSPLDGPSPEGEAPPDWTFPTQPPPA